MINDEYILTYFYGMSHKRLNKDKLENIPENILKYLYNRYDDSLCIEETLQRIKMGCEVHPICVCGNPCKYVGSTRFFLNSCGNTICSKIIGQKHTQETCLEKYGETNVAKSDVVKEKTKKTCLEKYGEISPLQNNEVHNKTIETNILKYGMEYSQSANEVKEKIANTNRKTCSERYGVSNIMQLDNIKEKQQETVIKKYGCDNVFKSDIIKEKIKQTNLDRYGVEYASQNKEIKKKIVQSYIETNIKLYGVKYASQNEEIKNKIKETCRKVYKNKTPEEILQLTNKIQETKRKNNTWNTSTIEQQLYEYFNTNNINCKYQYKSELYPYCCDFYFPDKDLYVEIQGNWTHGGKPFENTEDDNIKLNKWKNSYKEYYKNAIHTWTISDVNKRNIAKQNKLNYLEIFSINLDECLEKILCNLTS